MASSIQCSITSFTHIGNRAENQDRCSVMPGPDQSRLLCLVADGMGGHKGGALAALTIIETANNLWQEQLQLPESDSATAETFLQKLVTDCHAAVNKAGEAKQLEPRSTLAALYVYLESGELRAVSIHAGDSRITQYSMTQKIHQSFDHSLAQLKVLQGKITAEEMANDPDQGTVISNIGGEDPPDPEITHWDLQKGCRFTVCSDGFWEIFSNEEVLGLFALAEEPRKKQLETSFLEKIRSRPKHDNTTVIMVEINTSNQDSDMSNSDQDKNAGQTPTAPEVEDPITNPGKQEAYKRPATKEVNGNAGKQGADSTAAVTGKSSKNNLWIMIGLVLIIVIALAVFFSGTSEQGAADGSQAQQDNARTQDTLAEADNGELANPGGEASGEGDNAVLTPQQTTVNNNSEGTVREDRVLDSVDLQTDIRVASNEELIEEITDMLLLNDRLGPDDELSISTEGEVNGNRIIRMQQSHQGIPVFGAEIIAVENNGSVFNISGSTGNDIEISIVPGLTFQEALSVAENNLPMTVSPRVAETAQLLIIDIEGTYHLAWQQVMLIAGSEERVFLDAQDGSILLRLPTIIGEA